MSSFRFAILALLRRPISSLLAVLSVAVSIALGGVFLQLHAALGAAAGRVDPGIDVVVGPKSSALTLLIGGLHLGAYEHDMTVSEGSIRGSLRDQLNPLRPRHTIVMARFGNTDFGSPVAGVDEAFINRPRGVPAPSLGLGEWVSSNQDAVLGALVARQHGLGLADRISVVSDLRSDDGEPIWSGEFEIVGILEEQQNAWDFGVFVDLPAAQHVLGIADRAGLMPLAGYGESSATHIFFNLDPQRPIQWEQMFQIVHVRRSEHVVYVRDTVQAINDALGIGKGAGRGFILLLVLLASGIVSGLLAARFEGMKPSLGVLRALGYRRLDIARAMFIEAALLVVTGLVLGVLLDLLASSLVFELLNLPQIRSVGLFTPDHLLLWLGLLVVSLPFVLVPLFSLYRSDPHQALQGI